MVGLFPTSDLRPPRCISLTIPRMYVPERSEPDGTGAARSVLRPNYLVDRSPSQLLVPCHHRNILARLQQAFTVFILSFRFHRLLLLFLSVALAAGWAGPGEIKLRRGSPRAAGTCAGRRVYLAGCQANLHIRGETFHKRPPCSGAVSWTSPGTYDISISCLGQ